METNSEKRLIWAVSDGRAGNVAMVVGLAERVGALTDHEVVQRDLDVSGVRAWLAARLPWVPSRLQMATYKQPALVIGAGRRVAPAVAALGEAGAKTVQILNPQMAIKRFDLIVAPEHDGLSGANVVSTLGSVGKVSSNRLDREREVWARRFAELKRPLLAVLIGGATKRTKLTDAAVDGLIADLGALSETHGLLITASRRTGDANITKMRSALPQAWFWDGSGDNPYFGMLACADALLVTDDSVNMASEAAATGKPLALYPLLGEGGKIARFHAALIERGHAQWFDGSALMPPVGPLDETGRAAEAVAALLRLR